MSKNLNPFAEGKEAYYDHLDEDDNPYPKKTKEYSEWLKGFRKADKDNPLAYFSDLEY